MSKTKDKENGVEIDHDTNEVLPEIRKENDIEALKSLFKIALATRDFEITQLVQRNNFFMIFQGVLFAGVMQSSHTKPLVSFLVCLVGLAVSLFQVGMASGAKFWQEYWEEALRQVEKKLLFRLCGPEAQRSYLLALFHDDKKTYRKIVSRRLSSHKANFFSISSWLIMKQFSVSRIPIYVGLTLAVVWLLMISAVVDIQLTGFSFNISGF
ncbi:conserved membrane hypothetical protein [Vibrio chagasii]|nr:conserved membrane hypothetical protein [Vibrio chagasii]